MLDTELSESTFAALEVNLGARQADRVNGSGLKRLIDAVGAALGLLFLAPFLLLIAAAVRLDSAGPVFYRQWRNGRSGPFRILKFRSMSKEASIGPFRQAVPADVRVTRVGRVLRRFNLDELPQLWNVLMGDMSLVGPRPHPPALDEAFAADLPNLHLRYLVRPGITGWAQVNGLRGETAGAGRMAERVSHDLHYIANWSLLLDLQIIWRTLWCREAFRHAY